MNPAAHRSVVRDLGLAFLVRSSESKPEPVWSRVLFKARSGLGRRHGSMGRCTAAVCLLLGGLSSTRLECIA